MTPHIFLFILVLIILVNYNEAIVRRSNYEYKCFLLTIKDEKKRQQKFFKSHNRDLPIEIIYGPDTKSPKIAREYEEHIEPEYFEKSGEK